MSSLNKSFKNLYVSTSILLLDRTPDVTIVRKFRRISITTIVLCQDFVFKFIVDFKQLKIRIKSPTLVCDSETSWMGRP